MNAFAPGRVNVIGEHTDYVGGLALTCAIDLGITAEFERGGDMVELTSDATAEPARFALSDRSTDGASPWDRLVRCTVAEVGRAVGVRGRLTTTLPIGTGLSSSAACTIALALTVGYDGDPRGLVLAAQAAEQRATGVPCGVLDQMAIVHGRAGQATLIDAANLTAEPVPFPEGAAIAVIPSGHQRELRDTPYAQRVAEARAAMDALGGLANATLADAESLTDPLLRKRARHVVTENARVEAAVAAFRAGDGRAAGVLLGESHASLRHDAEVSTSDLDSLVYALSSRPGVFGARLMGAGFGGSVLALVDRAHAAAIAKTFGGHVMTPSDGARVTD